MRNPTTTSLTILGLALLLGACSGSGGGESPTSPLGAQPANVEFASFNLLNATREDNDVDPLLQLREQLSRVARLHSENMRDSNFMSHTDPDGKRLADRLLQAGIPYRTAAENLAQVTHAGNPAAHAHQLLMDSASHRGNILDEDFEMAGVGVARRGETYWITQIFIAD